MIDSLPSFDPSIGGTVGEERPGDGNERQHPTLGPELRSYKGLWERGNAPGTRYSIIIQGSVGDGLFVQTGDEDLFEVVEAAPQVAIENPWKHRLVDDLPEE